MELLKKEDNLSLAIQDIESTKKMCEKLMQTPHYAKMGREGIYAILAKAKSLEMNPVDALNGGLYYVGGKVGMSTEEMASRMRTAGHSITKDPESNNTICILHAKRSDNGDTWTTSFSIEDAKRAGIYKPNSVWEKYPASMCYNRAMSMMFRQLTPDLSKGAGYALDELHEISSKDVKVSQDVKVSHSETRAKITSDQAIEIEEILNECDPEYKEKVWKTLMAQGFKSLENIPEEIFDRIKKAASINRDDYLKKLLEIDEISEENEDLSNTFNQQTILHKAVGE